MNDEELSHLEALERVASARPWELQVWEGEFYPSAIYRVSATEFRRIAGPGYAQHRNMPLVVALRNAAPDLFAEVRRLRAVLERYANRGNWDNVYIHVWGHEGFAWQPIGAPWEIAREALAREQGTSAQAREANDD